MSRNGFRVEQVCEGGEALELLRLYNYDVILMDSRLADMPGHELLRRIRAAGCDTPVIALLDEVTHKLRVPLLDQGADDVVSVPCESDELFGRLRAIVRRSGGHAHSVLNLGPVELCLRRRELRVFGQVMSLSSREYELVELMFLRQKSTVSRTAILHHLHGADDDVDAKAVDVLVCRLRKKLVKAGVPELIQTRIGGYILSAPDGVAAPLPAGSRSPSLEIARPLVERPFGVTGQAVFA